MYILKENYAKLELQKALRKYREIDRFSFLLLTFLCSQIYFFKFYT